MTYPARPTRWPGAEPKPDPEQAFQSSCVWYFRQVIDQWADRRVAEQRAAPSYGNQLVDISQWRRAAARMCEPELNGYD